MYAIWNGTTGSSGYLHSVFHDKKKAESYIRAKGFKKERATGLFLRGDSWYRVDDVLCVDGVMNETL